MAILLIERTPRMFWKVVQEIMVMLDFVRPDDSLIGYLSPMAKECRKHSNHKLVTNAVKFWVQTRSKSQRIKTKDSRSCNARKKIIDKHESMQTNIQVSIKWQA